MKENKFFLCVFLMVIFMVCSLTLYIAAEITPDQYVFINTHTRIGGESDQGYLLIDCPTYQYDSSAGTLDSGLSIDLTDETKVIMGRGLSLGGSVGGGASTNLVLFDSLAEQDLFTVDDNGNVDYYNNNEWISLSPGQTWTRTFETTSYSSFTGNLIVTETVTNFGIWKKSNVTYPGSTPGPFPDPGDVDEDGSIDIVDALLVAQYYVGLNPSDFNAAYADVDCDGGVDIVDALLIAQHYVGLISEFC
jgi:hypothetical protein